MTNTETYIVHYVDPNGVQSVLGEVQATDEQAALIEMGNVVRYRRDDLQVDGMVSLTGSGGEVSGSTSHVGEHLRDA